MHPDAEFAFPGMAHKPSQLFEDSLFDGDENAIVDFKYSSNPKLTWWFDHHQSAFLTLAVVCGALFNAQGRFSLYQQHRLRFLSLAPRFHA
jgi:hypothetical protein